MSRGNTNKHDFRQSRDQRKLLEIVSCRLVDGPLKTDHVHKKIRGHIVSYNDIVTSLYQLAKEGVVIHHNLQSGSHVWELNLQEPISPIVVPIGSSDK